MPYTYSKFRHENRAEKNLVPFEWCLNESQKNSLRLLLNLNVLDESSFFWGIEHQMRWLQAPEGNKPTDDSDVANVLELTNKLINSLEKLSRYDLLSAGASMFHSITTIIHAERNLGDDGHRKISKNSIVFLPNNASTDSLILTRNEEVERFADQYFIDIKKGEVESYILTESSNDKSTENEYGRKTKKLEGNGRDAHCLSDIKLSHSSIFDPILALKYLSDELTTRKRKYILGSKLDLITESLSKPFIYFSQKRDRGYQVSSSTASVFIRYLEIVLSTTRLSHKYKDLNATLSKSVYRSKWWTHYKADM
jgi:hypothetical protein